VEPDPVGNYKQDIGENWYSYCFYARETIFDSLLTIFYYNYKIHTSREHNVNSTLPIK